MGFNCKLFTNNSDYQLLRKSFNFPKHFTLPVGVYRVKINLNALVGGVIAKQLFKLDFELPKWNTESKAHYNLGL